MKHAYIYEIDQKYCNLCSGIYQKSPPYFFSFYSYLLDKKRKPVTIYNYLCSLHAYLIYLKGMIPECDDIPFDDLPLFLFDKITEEDILAYHQYLHDVKLVSRTRQQQHMAALISFYRFLNLTKQSKNNPFICLDFSLPKPTAHKTFFSRQDIQVLLEGVLRNDKYLQKQKKSETVLAIPDKVFIRREPLVLRNHALLSLLFGTELRVSEIIGLDTSDIHEATQEIFVLNRNATKSRRITLSDNVFQSLKMYIHGTSVSPVTEYDQTLWYRPDIRDWCHAHLFDVKHAEHLHSEFPDETKEFYTSVKTLLSLLRRGGRNILKGTPQNEALFLSLRGNRMSVRSVEYLLKEMVQTYLPWIDISDGVSPEKITRFSEKP